MYRAREESSFTEAEAVTPPEGAEVSAVITTQ